MIGQLYFLTSTILAVICLAMGVCFLAFPTPKVHGLKNFKLSLKVLAVAYFVIAFIIITILALNIPDNSDEIISYSSLAISSLQAVLFAFTLITLFNPRFVTQYYIFLQLSPIVILTLLYIIFYSFYGDPKVVTNKDYLNNFLNPTLIVRSLFLLFYFFQIVYYTVLFFREERKYKEEINNYFSDEIQLKLSWVRYAYISAFTIGLFALISSFFPYKIFDIVFTILCTIFYFVFALLYINYQNIFSSLLPAIDLSAFIKEPITIKIRNKYDWEELKRIVITKKYYLIPGINIEDMARWLKVGRTTLSNYINMEEGMNFNSWINKFRIEDAKNLLIENPVYTVVKISELVGYSEATNFIRHFKQITKQTPSVWRKAQNVER